METNALTMSSPLVAAATTKSALANTAASASSGPSVSAEGPPPASATNPLALAGPPASAALRAPAVPPASDTTRSVPLVRTDSSTSERPLGLGEPSCNANPEPSIHRKAVPSNPRVLILSCEHTKLSSLSPFQRKEGCDRFGRVVRCDRLRDGSVEVEFASGADAAKALRATTFHYTARQRGEKREMSLQITVTPHRTKNFCKGVIRCPDLRDTSDEEIVDGLSSFGVKEARRITTRRGGSTIPTDSIILTFDSTAIPSTVTVGYTRVHVRTYVPNPMRCFRCQRFGHTKTHCRNRPACAKCSSLEHLDEDCDATVPRCVNCGDAQLPHTSYDRSCPSYVREKEIIALKATRNLSFKEARDMYNQSHPTVSYAQKAKTPVPVSNKTTLEGMSATQLIHLLKSFGLSIVASEASPDSVAPVASIPLVAPPPAAAASVPSSPSTSISGEGRTPAVPVGTAAAAGDGVDEEGWTLVQGRRSASGRRAPAGETAVAAALRRNAEEKRARDARRARLVEKARESRQSPGPDSDTDHGPVASVPSSPSGLSGKSPATVSSRSSMGPPPPPRRPRVPPPPLPSRSTSGERPPSTPQSTPRSLEPPPAPGRPGKRTLAWDGSPSGDGTPRTRHRPQGHPSGGRSSSADGRLLRGDGAHPRVQFRDGAANL